MTVPVKKTPRNKGRVQFLAARKRIQAMLEAGHDRKSIHDALTVGGGITICYSVFCQYMRKENEGRLVKPLNPDEAPAAALKTSVRRGGGLFKPEKSEPFSLDKSKSLEDLA